MTHSIRLEKLYHIGQYKIFPFFVSDYLNASYFLHCLESVTSNLWNSEKVACDLKSETCEPALILKYITPWKVVNWNVFKFSSVSSMGAEHFQATFRVITLGNIQIENNQIEKPLTMRAWLNSNAMFYETLKRNKGSIISYERGRGLEDFSFYSEIFWEATSEAWKFSGATQKLSVGFQLSKVWSHKPKSFWYYILVQIAKGG